MGKTIPSLLDGFGDDGKFCEELIHYSMERQYMIFSDYIYSCMKDMGKEFEKLRQRSKRDERKRRK